MLNFVEQRLKQVQVCFNCLVKIDTEYNIIKGDGSTCTSASCLDCLDSNLLCNFRGAKGHENVELLLRACDFCLENKEQCSKCLSICTLSDSESKNEKCLQLIMKKYKDETHDAKLKFLKGSSDPVHVDKRIYANLANWYIIVDSFRVNLSILCNI